MVMAIRFLYARLTRQVRRRARRNYFSRAPSHQFQGSSSVTWGAFSPRRFLPKLPILTPTCGISPLPHFGAVARLVVSPIWHKIRRLREVCHEGTSQRQAYLREL